MLNSYMVLKPSVQGLYISPKASLWSTPRNAECLNVNFHVRWNHSNTSIAMRKTFKKLYEQKDLVRNTKDQYGVVCDTIWKQSYQRLIVKDGVENLPELYLDFFDIKASKKIADSKNQYSVKISSTVPYQQTWLTSSSLINEMPILSTKDCKTLYSDRMPKASNSITKLLDRGMKSPNWVPSAPDRMPKASNWQATLPNLYVKNFEVKSNRKNIAKLLKRSDASNSKGDRSVVNNALENYSKRVKIKTLNES